MLFVDGRISLDDKVTYDCGNGEKSFDVKNYIPKREIAKYARDHLECKSQVDEANCHKAASKFLTNDLIACWKKPIKNENLKLIDKDKYKERCHGFIKKEYKFYFQNRFKNYLQSGDKTEEWWSCADKNGKKMVVYLNTITGKFKIT